MLDGLKLGTLSRKDSQGQSGTLLIPSRDSSKKLKGNFPKGKSYQKNKQGNSCTNILKKEKPQLQTSPGYNQGKIQKGRLFISLLNQIQYSLQVKYASSKDCIIVVPKSILYNTIQQKKYKLILLLRQQKPIIGFLNKYQIKLYSIYKLIVLVTNIYNYTKKVSL